MSIRHATPKSTVKRREFLKFASALAAAPIVSSLSYAHAATTPLVSVKDYGAKGDGISDDTAPVLAALRQNLNATVLVPQGTYLMRNPASIVNFSGRLQCAPGVRFLLTDGSQPGWTFQGGSEAIISNFRCAWQTPGTRRLGNSAGLLLVATVNTWVDNCVIENSNGSGITCARCVNPTIATCSVQNTLANGLMFLNSSNAIVIDARTDHTGDNGLEFFASAASAVGAYARNITVTNSHAHGIAVPGQSNVLVTGFSINGTGSSGISSFTDYSYNSLTPENVAFINGTIQNAGTFLPLTGNQYSVEIHRVTSTSVEGVTTIGGASRGVSVFAPEGSVALRDIRVVSPLNQDGANLCANALTVDRLRTENTTDHGIYIWNSPSVVARRLQAVNASKTSSLHRAIWMQHNGKIDMEMLHVADNQPVPTGYILGCYGSTQTGTIRGITSTIGTSGTVSVDSRGSPSVVVAA